MLVSTHKIYPNSFPLRFLYDSTKIPLSAHSQIRGAIACVIYRQVFWLRHQTQLFLFSRHCLNELWTAALPTQQRLCTGFAPVSLFTCFYRQAPVYHEVSTYAEYYNIFPLQCQRICAFYINFVYFFRLSYMSIQSTVLLFVFYSTFEKISIFFSIKEIFIFLVFRPVASAYFAVPPIKQFFPLTHLLLFLL